MPKSTDLIDTHIDPKTMGPAMQACTAMQRRFVICLLEMPNSDHTAAARMAGYADTGTSSIRSAACRLAHDPKVQAAIQEEAKKRMDGAAILAVSRLVEMLDNPGHKDHFKAITAVLNRVGLHEKSESLSTIRHEVADEAAIEKVVRLSALLGLDSAVLLGRAGVRQAPRIIDLTPEPHSAEGLEDLL